MRARCTHVRTPPAAVNGTTGASFSATWKNSLAIGTATEARTKAKLQGYTGDPCGECGNYTLVRNGTCLKCNTCGGTTGCS